MAKISDTQIANRNFLAPVGFKFSLSKFILAASLKAPSSLFADPRSIATFECFFNS